MPTVTRSSARRGGACCDFLREHPNAPIYRNHSGNRLDATDLAHVRREEAAVLAADTGWPRGGYPDWLADFVSNAAGKTCRTMQLTPTSRWFENLPTVSRADLGRDIAAFVPDSVPLDRLINFQTSGTTGHPLLIASHPRVAAGYLAYHKRALRRFGVNLTAGRGEVGVVLHRLSARLLHLRLRHPVDGRGGPCQNQPASRRLARSRRPRQLPRRARSRGHRRRSALLHRAAGNRARTCARKPCSPPR